MIVVPANGGMDLTDGETFVISQGGDPPVVFELDNDDDHARGNVRVPFEDTSSRNDVADAIALAIFTTTLPLTPTPVGQGRVHIGGDDETVLVTTNTAISQTGVPGITTPNAIAIPIVPSKSGQIAEDTAAAINAQVAASSLVGVVAEAYGSEVFLTGGIVSGSLGAVTRQVTPIRDLAGNALQPNRVDSTTRFTILTGLGVDYGDAPSQYPVLIADNGAGHEIVAGFYLGNFVDAENDGLPSVLADADASDDGVVFPVLAAGLSATIGVTASAAGFLDAWIDNNGDGDWNDAGEQIFASEPLVAGTNSLPFDVRSLAETTYTRFRFSSTGGLAPTGMAADGEVEDYLVEVVPNPWQNTDNPLDVNADTFVTPLDALLIINLLNLNPGISDNPLPLPKPGFEPPPYYDVNGDGYVAPIDAAIVINWLNLGEGEGEGEGGTFLASDGPAEGEGDVLVNNGLDSGNGMDAGFFGGQLLVESATYADVRTESSRWTRAADVDPVESPLTGEEDDRLRASDLASVSYRNLAVEDLLADIAEDLEDGDDVEEAREAIFARFGV